MADQNGTPGSTETSGSVSTNYVNILVIGTDLGFAKQVQNALATVAANNPDKTYRVFPGTEEKKTSEFLEKYKMHSILIQEENVGENGVEGWVKKFKDDVKKYPSNVAAPLVFVAPQTTNEKTRKLMRLGFVDVFLKPLDNSLFVQKMNLFNKEIKILAEDILFTNESDHEVDLAFNYKTKSFSEYGLRVDANKPLDPGTLVTVAAPFLEERVVAVVRDSVKVSETSYLIQMMFVGMPPSETQAIRRFIRQEYAEEKQAA